MRTDRVVQPATERYVIDLEQDFENRTQVIAWIHDLDILSDHEVQNELINAENPVIWIKFTIRKQFHILNISLS